MCGIVGLFDMRGAREIDREQLHRMNENQFHRRPVEGGLHVERGLSIIDQWSGQRLFNADHSVIHGFNGKRYHFHRLMDELAGRAATRRYAKGSRSDGTTAGELHLFDKIVRHPSAHIAA